MVFQDARVVVTGAASGLGAALTAQLRACGARVLATDLAAPDPDDGESLRLDVTSEDDWAAAVRWVDQSWGGLDVLVNNAGVAGGGRLDVCTIDEWRRVTEVNLFGAVHGTRAFTPVFKRQRSGRIVNVASLAGLVHPAGMASYNAVKAAVVALTETTGHELAAYGVHAHAVCPSYFRTDLIESLQGADTSVGAVLSRLVESSPYSADQIATAVLDGVERGEELILPDEASRSAYRLKRDDRAAYDRMMREQARKLEESVNQPDGGTGTVEGAKQVREEDAFDVEAVAEWLRANADPAVAEGLIGTPEVRQFSGGASNLTYLLRYADRDLILRRAPRGTKARGAHDMRREYHIQSRLKPVFGYVPEMIGFCDDESVIGGDFYVMARIDGVVPRADLAPETLSEAQARRLCLKMIDVLVELHSVDAEAAGLGSLGKGLGYVRRQVEGWSTRCRNAHTDDAPDFDAVMGWLADHQPEDVANCVIHNDFKMDNLVFDRADPTEVVGVLDWEMATLGDPLMDLGGDLAFWVQADDDEEFQLFRRVPTHLPGMISREEFVQRYCERMGFSMTPEQWRFYEVFGLFRLAVISQQIYYRYFHKQTTNEMFALFGPATHLAAQRIERILGWR